MKNGLPLTFLSFLSLTLLTLVTLGCSSKGTGPPMTATAVKPQETLFTVIETEDPAYPTLAAAIRLPFRVTPENTVILAEQHAYLTTESHLHAIDLSIPQRPVYLTSLAFSDAIGKVLASGHHLVVATRKSFHLVDVSQPSSPVVASTEQLPYRHALRDITVHADHLYVVGENDTLYVFSIDFGQVRLLSAVKLEKRWWLLSPKGDGTEVEQVTLSTSNRFPGGLSRPLLSGNGFLQLQSNQGEKVRASSEFLGVERLKEPTTDINIYNARRRAAHKMTSSVGYYRIEAECREHLATIEKKHLTRRKPTLAYRLGALGEMQQIAEDPSSETIDTDTKRFMGSLTDFQLSDAKLYVVNAKGFLAIFRVGRIENTPETERRQLLSVTPLQASRPISIAIGQDYVCVLAVSGDPRR